MNCIVTFVGVAIRRVRNTSRSLFIFRACARAAAPSAVAPRSVLRCLERVKSRFGMARGGASAKISAAELCGAAGAAAASSEIGKDAYDVGWRGRQNRRCAWRSNSDVRDVVDFLRLLTDNMTILRPVFDLQLFCYVCYLSILLK